MSYFAIKCPSEILHKVLNTLLRNITENISLEENQKTVFPWRSISSGHIGKKGPKTRDGLLGGLKLHPEPGTSEVGSGKLMNNLLASKFEYCNKFIDILLENYKSKQLKTTKNKEDTSLSTIALQNRAWRPCLPLSHISNTTWLWEKVTTKNIKKTNTRMILLVYNLEKETLSRRRCCLIY